MFLFKKIVSKFLFPLPFCFLIALAGLYLLWFTKKQKAGKALVSIGLVMIFLFSSNFVANRLVFPFENRYSKFETQISEGKASLKPQSSIRFVVVLGGGHVTNTELPITSQLNEPVIVRLIEGIRIQRQYPEAKLILSGGTIRDPNPQAKLLAELALELGVSEKDIILESESKDTKDEALMIRALVENHPFALVTSASHMPRAMALFRKAGMNPIAAPTDHLVKDLHGSGFSTWFPSALNLHKSERAVYESLGILWAKLRSQI